MRPISTKGVRRRPRLAARQWPIDWEYTYADLDPAHPEGGTTWTTNWVEIQKALHTGTQYENGRFEIFKGHVGCSECMKPVVQDLGAAS